MAELTELPGPAPVPGSEPMPESLPDRLARVARALADALVRHGSTAGGAQQAAEFVRDWAANGTSCSSMPTADLAGRQPVDGLTRLGGALGLTAAELDLVTLAGLPYEHEGLAATFRALHPAAEPYPTLGLAALLDGGSATDRARIREILARGLAVSTGLLQVGPGTGFERSLRLPDGIWETVAGFDGWPTDLPRLTLTPPPPGLTDWLDTLEARRAIRALERRDSVVVLLIGEDESAGLSRAAALAQRAGQLLVGTRCAPSASTMTLLGLHAAVRDAVPLVAYPRGEHLAELADLQILPDPGPAGPCVVLAHPGQLSIGGDRALVAVPIGPVGDHDQQTAWAAAVPALAEDAGWLASHHRLDPVHTARVGRDLQAVDTVGTAGASRDAVSGLVRLRAAAVLPPGVELVTPAVDWDHLVLPADELAQLRDAVDRLDHRVQVLQDWGLAARAHADPGIRMLLCGPPGTGKSLAAQAVATAAATDLLVVDVSRLVSKWLGETEKNLSAAFDAAERTQAVLMLDEADALFATRTEVSDAHDRYANLETAYLLQRLERFAGLAILTTNLRANIDPAFLRRLDYVIEFPLPDQAGRLQLWRRHLPEALDHTDLDLDDPELAGLAALYPVPGAWIRNACVDAAFAAAAARGPISLDHLVAAMRRGYQKSSVPFPGVPRRRHVRT